MGDVASPEAKGSKKTVHQRLGGKICIYWLQGRCTRYYCPFVHGNPSTISQQPHDGLVPKRPQQCRRGSLVWKNPNTMGSAAPSARDRGRGGPPRAGQGVLVGAGGPSGLREGVVTVVAPDACKNDEGGPRAPRQGEVAAIVVALDVRPQNPPGQGDGADAIVAPDMRKDDAGGLPAPGQEQGAVVIVGPRGPPGQGDGADTVVVADMHKDNAGDTPALRQGEGIFAVVTPDASKDDEGGPPVLVQGEGDAIIVGPDLRKDDDGGICKFFVKGCCTFGESCKFVHSWSVGNDFTQLTSLVGHQKVL